MKNTKNIRSTDTNAPILADLSFTVPLSDSNRQLADRFRCLHPEAQKANQIYRQLLALLSVEFYCNCMGIPNQLEHSDSWNFIQQTLSDSAALPLTNIGVLECCLVRDAEPIVEGSAEAFENRFGYIAVSFSPSYDEAYLVGFRKHLSTEHTPLSEWDSLEMFLDAIETATRTPPHVQLQGWLQHQFEPGWKLVSQAIESSETAVVFRKPPSHRGIERIKYLEFSNGQQIGLQVGVYPTQAEEIDVCVRIVPPEDRVLPVDLQVSVLDAEETIVMHARSRETRTLRLEFSIEPQEVFKLKLQHQSLTFTEIFAF